MISGQDATIAKIWEIVQAEQVLPIHNQVLNWGMSENIASMLA